MTKTKVLAETTKTLKKSSAVIGDNSANRDNSPEAEKIRSFGNDAAEADGKAVLARFNAGLYFAELVRTGKWIRKDEKGNPLKEDTAWFTKLYDEGAAKRQGRALSKPESLRVMASYFGGFGKPAVLAVTGDPYKALVEVSPTRSKDSLGGYDFFAAATRLNTRIIAAAKEDKPIKVVTRSIVDAMIKETVAKVNERQTVAQVKKEKRETPQGRKEIFAADLVKTASEIRKDTAIKLTPKQAEVIDALLRLFVVKSATAKK